jgi:large subunit ribosomal protein L20
MPRSKNGTRRRDRRHKIMKLAKGYWGGRSRLFKTAKEAVMKALASSYRDRRRKKGEFRRLWITRISAAVRPEGITYSQFIHGLILAEVQLNRKALSNMAIEDPTAFKAVIARAKEALEADASAAKAVPAGASAK